MIRPNDFWMQVVAVEIHKPANCRLQLRRSVPNRDPTALVLFGKIPAQCSVRTRLKAISLDTSTRLS